MLKKFIRSVLPTTYLRRRANRRLVDRFGLHVVDLDQELVVYTSTFGSHCRLSGPLSIHGSELGDYSYVEPFCRIASTTIGKFCSIASNCVIGPPNHPVDRASTHPAFYLNIQHYAYQFVDTSNDPSAELRTAIGNDVWLGANVFIKRGVTIGDGAIVGAGSVVTKDVEPYSIVVGVPAKVLRQRFDAETMSRLQASRWWDRDPSWLASNAHLMSDVKSFLEQVEADFGR